MVAVPVAVAYERNDRGIIAMVVVAGVTIAPAIPAAVITPAVATAVMAPAMAAAMMTTPVPMVEGKGPRRAERRGAENNRSREQLGRF